MIVFLFTTFLLGKMIWKFVYLVILTQKLLLFRLFILVILICMACKYIDAFLGMKSGIIFT